MQGESFEWAVACPGKSGGQVYIDSGIRVRGLQVKPKTSNAWQKHFNNIVFPLGEVTEVELLSRLQQIKDGPEPPNSSPSTETGEATGGESIKDYIFLKSGWN